MEQKYCDYCNKAINAGEQYYLHGDYIICIECARKYAWDIFKEESELCYSASDQLLSDKDYKYIFRSY